MVDSYERFLASAPVVQREIRTIEIFHPALSQVFRFISGFSDASLTLEATAERNPGEVVAFTAAAMIVTEPAESNDGEQTLSVSLGALGSAVSAEVKAIDGVDFLTPIQIIYRKYYTGDLTGPVIVLNLSAATLQFDSYTQVSFIAEDTDFANKTSGEIYTLERFPTLAGI